VTIGGNATNAGEIRIMEDSDAGTNYVAIKAQNMSASYTLTLPADDGCCGETLTTNGSGTLTWAAAGGGTTINNATANELVTIGATTTELCGEAGLTYNADTVEFTMSGTGQQDMIVRNTGTGDAIITSSVDGGSANAIVFFKEATTTKYGLIYNTNSNRLALRSGSLTSPNDGDILRIADGAHNVEVTNGNIIIGTSGKGVCFDAAAGGDSQLLDYYEEGTFTPHIWDTNKTTNASVTYHNRAATYTRIGNRVFFNISWNWNDISALDAGLAYFGGLPFTAGANPTGNIRSANAMGYLGTLNFPTNASMLQSRVDSGRADIDVTYTTTGASFNIAYMTVAHANNSGLIDVSGHYEVA